MSLRSRHEARLAGAGRAHDRDRPAGGNVEVDVVEHDPPGGQEGVGGRAELVVGGS